MISQNLLVNIFILNYITCYILEFRKSAKIILALLLNSISDILDIRQISRGVYKLNPQIFEINKFLK